MKRPMMPSPGKKYDMLNPPHMKASQMGGMKGSAEIIHGFSKKPHLK